MIIIKITITKMEMPATAAIQTTKENKRGERYVTLC